MSRPRPARTRTAVALLAAAALLGACGSDDPKTGATTATGAELRPELGTATAEIEPASGAGQGDDDPGATTTDGGATAPAPSKASYIAFADGVCTRLRTDVAALGRGARANDAGYRARRLAQLFAAATEKLTKRPRPRADRRDLDAYLLHIAGQRTLLGQLASAAERGDAAEVKSATLRVDSVAAAARTRAKAYGLRVCSAG
jgi:hypothetical protein